MAVERTMEDVRREIGAERTRLADSLEELRAGVSEVTDVRARIGERLPLALSGATAAGFVLAGGLGATLRLLARRGREGKMRASVGRFRVVEHD